MAFNSIAKILDDCSLKTQVDTHVIFNGKKSFKVKKVYRPRVVYQNPCVLSVFVSRVVK